MEVLAQKFLKKWLGKTRHYVWSDNSSPFRIDIYKKTVEARNDINLLMDLLEKGFETEKISEVIDRVSTQIDSLRRIMRSLNAVMPIPKGQSRPANQVDNFLL